MIEKWDGSIDMGFAASIQIQSDLDLGFPGFATDVGGSFHFSGFL